jgi:transcriptional regulator with XRE-family HTH domain
LNDILIRIKELRQYLDLSQSEFADKMKLKRNSITLIETGKRSPSDRTIADICREFKVSEEWLRTGEGEMFKAEENNLDYLMGKYGDRLTEPQRALIAAILKMDDKQRAAVDNFIDDLIAFRNKT